MQPPHWIDEIFENPQAVTAAITHHERFLGAIAAGQAAFYETEEFLKKNPKVIGSSPPQAARNAFLDSFSKP